MGGQTKKVGAGLGLEHSRGGDWGTVGDGRGRGHIIKTIRKGVCSRRKVHIPGVDGRKEGGVAGNYLGHLEREQVLGH